MPPMTTNTDAPSWPREARWLHLALAAGVTFQLFSSLIMTPRWEKADYGSLGGLLFSAHSWVGLLTALVILWYWLYILSTPQQKAHLFPLGGGGWALIADDLRGLLRGHLPPPGLRGGLPGLVHGLGILAVTAMGITGSAVFFFLPQGGTPPGPIPHAIAEVHSTLSNLVWAYWLGHVGMALLHAWRGHPLWGVFRVQ